MECSKEYLANGIFRTKCNCLQQYDLFPMLKLKNKCIIQILHSNHAKNCHGLENDKKYSYLMTNNLPT